MEMKYQPVTEEELDAIFSRSTGPREAVPPAATSSMPSEAEDDEDEDEAWRYEYVSEDDIARENGCWIDDDGHWQPIEDEYDW